MLLKGIIFKFAVVVGAVAILITAVCWPTGSLSGGSKAPEFQAIANWINSRPLTMKQLRGRVVLVE